MARFWDVQGGSVSLGGHDVREYSYDSLIRNFSFVFQRTYLFSDTIANNIRFGKTDATDEEIEAAARKACCHDFIMRLLHTGAMIEVISPASLRQTMKEWISDMYELYKND